MKPTDSFFPPRPTTLAHDLLQKIISEGDTVVDATAGNGHDTLFLAKHVGESGMVHAFDIQPEAIESAQTRIHDAEYSSRVQFHNESHTRMQFHLIEESASVVMFNLGYLPGGDHALTTIGNETLAALEAATVVLKYGGVLSVICYPGHDDGSDEAVVVENWMERLTENGWRVARYQSVGTRKPSPFLLIAMKA